jgi:crotonobetainyl-CoA:carnitine CoA-transferase CaiB-like acyl-CoA transferase
MEEDERLRDMQSRTTHAEVAGQILADELAKKSSEEWLAAFRSQDIPACRVNSVEDLFDNPHLRAVGFFREMEHPTEGPLTVARPALNFSRTPLEIRFLAPRLGEHNSDFGLAKPQ